MTTQDANHRPWVEFEIARIVLEARTALLPGAGEGDRLVDAVFATDANRLPALPGDTIAGILRHTLAGLGDPAQDASCRNAFGFQEQDRGQASAVRVSWGQVHGADDRPVPFRGASTSDPVLAFLAAGQPRDHVRIGPHGAVDGRGKYDELVVPAGARFTFELAVDTARARLGVADLVHLLRRTTVRFGSGSRRGLGHLVVRRARSRRFDLRRAEDRAAYARLPVALEQGDAGLLQPMHLEGSGEPSPGWVHGKLELRALDTFLVAGTIASGREPPRGEQDAKKGWDRFPLTERCIRWTPCDGGERGVVVDAKQAPFVVPGSSIKGALRHRTAFHSRRLTRTWLAPNAPPADLAEGTEAERELFGRMRSRTEGEPGRLLVSDAQVIVPESSYAAFQHVCLDRFTQGPRDRLLFDEVAVFGGKVVVDLALRVEGLGEVARKALVSALSDLCTGRLALGAGRDHGRFHGTITWSDQGRWQEQTT